MRKFSADGGGGNVRGSGRTAASPSAAQAPRGPDSLLLAPVLSGDEFLRDAKALEDFLDEWELVWPPGVVRNDCNSNRNGAGALVSQTEVCGESPSSSGLATPVCGDARTQNDAKRKIATDPIASGDTSQLSKKRRESSNTWWKRQRQELLDLRESSKSLALQLQQLKLERGINSTLPLDERAWVGGKSVSAKRVAIGTFGETWNDVAKRESLARQRAVSENARLRAIMTSQTTYARKLQRVLRGMVKTSAVDEPLKIPRNWLCQGSPRAPEDNGAVFTRLLAGLDDSYAKVDNVFGASEVANLACPGQASRKWLETGGLRAQILDRYRVPFDDRSTERAVWKVMSGRAAMTSRVRYAEVFDWDANTCLSSKRIDFRIESLEIDLLLRVASRKYIEDDRTVFVQHQSVVASQVNGLCASSIDVTTRVLKGGELQTHVLGAYPRDFDANCFSPNSLLRWQHSLTRFNHAVEDAALTSSSNAA